MKRSEIRQQYVRINRAFEVKYAPKVRKALNSIVAKAIADLRSGGYKEAINRLHSEVGNKALPPVIESLYKEVGLRHARLTSRRVVADQKKGLGFNEVWTNFIINYLRQHLIEKITFDVSATTRRMLLRVLSAGVASGMGIDDMVSELKDWDITRRQAARIVRTEVNTAANVGATAQEETSEYEQQKEWISVTEYRTRGRNPKDHANHIALNGTRIDAGDEFVDPRNKDRLKFPGDPNGRAESIINCRCQVAYVNKRDNNGNLIKKRKTTAVIYPGQKPRGQMITI
jgi:hypothetical protein